MDVLQKLVDRGNTVLIIEALGRAAACKAVVLTSQVRFLVAGLRTVDLKALS